MKERSFEILKNIGVAVLGLIFFSSIGLGVFQYMQWNETAKQTKTKNHFKKRTAIGELKGLRQKKEFIQKELKWVKSEISAIKATTKGEGASGVYSALKNYRNQLGSLQKIIDTKPVYTKAEQEMREFYLFNLNRNYKNLTQISEKYFNKWKKIKKHIMARNIVDIKNWTILLTKADEVIAQAKLRRENKIRISSMIGGLKTQQERILNVINTGNAYLQARKSVNLFAQRVPQAPTNSKFQLIFTMVLSVIVSFISLIGLVRLSGIGQKHEEFFQSQVERTEARQKIEDAFSTVEDNFELPENPTTDDHAESMTLFEEETFDVNETTPRNTENTNLTAVVQEILFDLSPLIERIGLNVQFNDFNHHMVKGNHVEIYDAYEATLYEIFTHMDKIGASKEFKIDIKEVGGKTLLEVRFHSPGFNAEETQLHHTLGPIDKKLRQNGGQIGLKNVYSGKSDLMYSCVGLRFEKV